MFITILLVAVVGSCLVMLLDAWIGIRDYDWLGMKYVLL
jgi:hypothetical protein